MKTKDLKVGMEVAIGNKRIGPQYLKHAVILEFGWYHCSDIWHPTSYKTKDGSGRHIAVGVCYGNECGKPTTWHPQVVYPTEIICTWEEAQKFIEEDQKKTENIKKEKQARNEEVKSVAYALDKLAGVQLAGVHFFQEDSQSVQKNCF